MLEFAKAYLVRPRLCLIDEPSIGLAPKIAEDVYRWIELFAQERMAILLVDHNVRRVVRMSQYIYVLSLGEIAAEGRPRPSPATCTSRSRAGWASISEPSAWARQWRSPADGINSCRHSSICFRACFYRWT